MRVSESAFSVSAFILERSFDSWLGRRKKKTENSLNEVCTFIFLVLHKTLFFLTRVKQVVNKGGEGVIVEMRALNAALLFFLPRIIGLFFFRFFFSAAYICTQTNAYSIIHFFSYFPSLQCDTHPFLHVDRIEKWKLGDQDKEGTEGKKKKKKVLPKKQKTTHKHLVYHASSSVFLFFFWLWPLFFYFFFYF